MSADEFVTLPVSGPFVAVPADVAKHIAAFLRSGFGAEPSWADLLDPQPPSLREQVSLTIFDTADGRSTQQRADAVLAVVADWLAAQPLVVEGSYRRAQQRVHDVRLLRGQS